MSSTTLYTINADGTFSTWCTYRNSHGSAPAVWSTLAAKYIPNVTPVGERWREGQRHAMMEMGGQPAATDDLWKIANAGGMEDYERRTCWMTYDRACVRTEDLPLYAAALAEFARVYGPIHEQHGYVFHIGKMAADLLTIHAESEAKGWRGVAWNQTSVADTWYEREPTEDMLRTMVHERVMEEIGDSALTVGVAVDIIVEMIEAMQEDELRVEDNVDAFGCLWLPGAGKTTLDDED